MGLSMDRKEKSIERGETLLGQGYNCAQSVLLVMQDYWKEKKPLEPKIASAFGGGIGGKGSLCGALSGGVIAIGSKYGSNKPIPKERRKTYSMALRFFERFKEIHGSVYCRDIIKFDLTDPEERKKAWDSNIFVSKCLPLVKETIKFLIDLESS